MTSRELLGGALRGLRRPAEWLRWLLLVVAVAIVVVFLVAQKQSANVDYGKSPATAAIAEGSAGELTGATLPSVDQMTAMVAANRTVRLPGSVAQWDSARVAAAIGDADVRILVAPPGLTEDQRSQLYDVQNATIRIIGTRVAGGLYEVTASTLPEWRDQFARYDVTSLLVAMINALDKRPDGSGSGGDVTGGWRQPTDAELATVADGLRAGGRYTAPGANLSSVPSRYSTQAFGTDSALYVALPIQPSGPAAPDYGPALTKLFPDTPIVVMYGDWIAYYGPHSADFADVAGASFYARYGDRLSGYAYPQDKVLAAYLGEVTDLRFAGLFDRPLPYQPFDPVRVALPALPWLFAACVAVFLGLSARSLLHHPVATPQAGAAARRGGVPARLAGLTALAVEVSALTTAATDPALTRAIGKLGAARTALDEGLPDRHLRTLLDSAERDLDSVGRALEFPGYRPAEYLRGRLA